MAMVMIVIIVAMPVFSLLYP